MDDFKKKAAPRTPQPFVLPDYKTDGLVSTNRENIPPRQNPLQKSRRPFRFLLTLISLCLLIAGVVLLFAYKSVSLGESMQFENTPRVSFVTSLKKLTHNFFSSQPTPLQGEQEGRINILLLGRAGEHYPGKNLTDTVIVLSIDTLLKKVALLSLPRDLYVPIGGTDLYTKLNSVYQYGITSDQGITPLKQTIETVTGTPIHYFVTLDFDGFEKIVDTLGGISLEVPRDFSDPRYPGKNYSYELFEIKKGWQTLDGTTALKYVRERHDDPAGDFGRAKRQQQVIQALKDKAFSLGTFFNIVTLDRLIEALGESVKTDMTVEDMGRFLELSRTIDTKNATTVVIDAWKKESLLRVSHVQVGPVSAFILVPRVGSWNEIREVSATLFHRDVQERAKQAVLNEEASATLFVGKNDADAGRRLSELLREELGFATVLTAPIPPSFPNRLEKSIMVERASLAKPFSLDSLLKKFSLERADRLPFFPSREATTDYSIVIGTDLSETFSLEEGDTLLNTAKDASFSEPLPPQPLTKRR